MGITTGNETNALAAAMLRKADARVVFCAARPTGGDGLFQACGDGVRALTVPFEGSCRTPAFSPDGRFVAFSQDDGAGASLCVSDLHGNAKVLTTSSCADYAPAWSADGSWLAWCRCPAMILERANEAEIWASPWPDFEPRRLTANARMDCYPVFAPSGAELIFESGRSDALFGLFSVTLTGKERPLLYEPEVSGNGIPHVHGDRIVFERALAANPALYDVYSLDRTEPLALTRHTFFERHVNPTPRYSPVGSRIAYHMPEGEECQVHLIDPRRPASPPMRLASAGAWLCYPRFSGNGRLLAIQDYHRACLWVADASTGEMTAMAGIGPLRVTRFLELYNHDIV